MEATEIALVVLIEHSIQNLMEAWKNDSLNARDCKQIAAMLRAAGGVMETLGDEDLSMREKSRRLAELVEIMSAETT